MGGGGAEALYQPPPPPLTIDNPPWLRAWVIHIFVNTTVLVFLLTDIALFMTSYTDQKTRNMRTYLNDCERAENVRLSRLKFVGK